MSRSVSVGKVKRMIRDNLVLQGLLNGTDGTDGTDGHDGKSAYEIAVQNGFVGTEAQWLDSLKGTGSGGNGSDGLPGKPSVILTTVEAAIAFTDDENIPVGTAALYLGAYSSGTTPNGVGIIHSGDIIEKTAINSVECKGNINGQDGDRGDNGKDGIPSVILSNNYSKWDEFLRSEYVPPIGAVALYKDTEPYAPFGTAWVKDGDLIEKTARGFAETSFRIVGNMNGKNGNDGQDGRDGADGVASLVYSGEASGNGCTHEIPMPSGLCLLRIEEVGAHNADIYFGAFTGADNGARFIANARVVHALTYEYSLTGTGNMKITFTTPQSMGWQFKVYSFGG